jgi:hypothetical protein
MPEPADGPPFSIDDLLTDEQREHLRVDLAEMARVRRRAEVESRNLPIGGQ